MKDYLWIAYVLIGLGLGSWVTANSKNAEIAQIQRDHANAVKATAELHLEVLQEREQEQLQLRKQLQAVDEQRYGELIHAQGVIDQLSADLLTAKRRLSVRTAPSTGSCSVSSGGASPSLDDGAGERRDIHPEDAAAIVRLTGEADQCRAKVTGLQERMRLLTGEKT